MLMMPARGDARMSQAKAPMSGGTKSGITATTSNARRPGTSVRTANQARLLPTSTAPAVPASAVPRVAASTGPKPPAVITLR